jgi:hypothetical protein
MILKMTKYDSIPLIIIIVPLTLSPLYLLLLVHRIHCEFVCLLFLQTHRETDHYFVTSGVQLVQSISDQLHYHLVTVVYRFMSSVYTIYQ